MIEILDCSEDASGFSLDLVQFGKQFQSISCSFEGNFLLKVLILVAQAKWCHLSRLLHHLFIMSGSTLFRIILEYIYLVNSILIAMEIDILSKLYASDDLSELWSCVDPEFIPLLQMKSANLSGVVGFLLSLRTE